MVAILGCFILGFEFVFVAQALDEIMPMHLLSLRFSLSALALTFLRIIGFIKIDLRKTNFVQLIILSVLQPVIYFILETIGINMTSAMEAGIIIATIPVVVTILAFLLLKEHSTILQVLSSTLSICGIILIMVMTGTSGAEGSFLGLLLLSMAVLIYAIYMILVRKVSSIFTPVEITYVMMWFGAIVFNFISIGQHWYNGSINQYFLPLRSNKVLISVIYLGIISTLAFFLGNYLIAKIGASKSAVFANLTTIIAILAGIILRHDHFYWYHAVGTIMIIVGIFGSVSQKNAESA